MSYPTVAEPLDVLIVSGLDDPHAEAVTTALRRRDARVNRLGAEDLISNRVSIDPVRPLITANGGEIGLMRTSSVWYFRTAPTGASSTSSATRTATSAPATPIREAATRVAPGARSHPDAMIGVWQAKRRRFR